MSLYSRLYLVSQEGEQLFIVEPTKRKPLVRYLTFFSVVSSGLLVPITYDVMSLNRSPIFSFTVKNDWKQFRVTILDEQEETIGVYCQPWRTSVLKNQGVLYLDSMKLSRKIESKNMTGDIDIRDEESRLLHLTVLGYSHTHCTQHSKPIQLIFILNYALIFLRMSVKSILPCFIFGCTANELFKDPAI